MRVNVGILIVRVVLGVLRRVGTHHEVFSGNRTEGNLFLLAVTVVVMLQVRDDRNGGAVHKGQAPSGTSLQSGIKALVATEVKVTEGTTARNVVIAGLIVPLIHNLTISVADSGTDHRIPHLGGNQGFKSLTEPSEIRVGVRDAEDGAMDGDDDTLRERDHLNRQVTQSVEVANLVVVTEAFSEGIIHDTGVLGDNLILWLVEEVFLEIVNEPGLTECLEAEIHDTIPSFNSGRARSKITDRLGHTGVKHLAVNRLVKVFK
jgi:hypothetical protein